MCNVYCLSAIYVFFFLLLFEFTITLQLLKVFLNRNCFLKILETAFINLVCFHHQNWKNIKAFCNGNNLLFIPSVGSGYIDTSIRPWNNHNTRKRVNGQYYETALAALNTRLEIITITSFNEWHEGTQIERAVPKKTINHMYLDYHRMDLVTIWH